MSAHAFDATWLAEQRRTPGRVLAEHGAAVTADAAARQRSEEDEQRDVVAWRDANAAARPELRLLVHVPNGEYRPRATAGRLRALGTTAGIPDLLLLSPSGPWCGLAVEMKAGENDLSPVQAQALRLLQAAGWAVDVCWTARQAVHTVTHYLDEPGAFVGGL